MKYIYGPVKSRRLGLSLGISLTPYKICNFDCIYCQLGQTFKKTEARREYTRIEDILEELKNWIESNPAELKKLKYITLSGSGEPTLNIKIGSLISRIKKMTFVPVAVITNASLLHYPQARHALLGAELIVPSLDAATTSIFKKIDRPFKGIKLQKIIDGLVALRKEFSGKIWLEIMLVKGINDDARQIKKLKEIADKINPDKIQLNSPVRTTAVPGILPLERKELEKIRKIFGEKAEII